MSRTAPGSQKRSPPTKIAPPGICAFRSVCAAKHLGHPRRWRGIVANAVDDLRRGAVCRDGDSAAVCLFLRVGSHRAGSGPTHDRAVTSRANRDGRCRIKTTMARTGLYFAARYDSDFAGLSLFIIPGVIAATVYALYAPVVIMEQHGVRGTLRRSRTLSGRAFWTALVITVVQFALPVLVWRAAVTTDFTLRLNDDFSPKEFGFNFSMSKWSSLYQLLNVFVTPLTAIMASLLYLKTRRAGGESLRDTSDQFEALDIPRSKWQARMKSRWTTHTSHR